MVAAISCRIVYKGFIRRRYGRYGKFIGARPKFEGVILKKARCAIWVRHRRRARFLAGHRAVTADPRQCYLGYLATAARIIGNRFA
jgi:hypothetical protein